MFKVGDKVKIHSGTMCFPTVQAWLTGKVGTVTAICADWDYEVYFPDTPRPDGMFGFFEEDLEKVA